HVTPARCGDQRPRISSTPSALAPCSSCRPGARKYEPVREFCSHKDRRGGSRGGTALECTLMGAGREMRPQEKHWPGELIRALAIGALATSGALVCATGAQAWTLKTLYNFCAQENCADGSFPLAGLA